MDTPVLDALKRLAEEKTTSFHTPGHKGKNTLIDWARYIPMVDTTEIQGMDNLLEPRGIIKESQEAVAKVFEARSTYYSVNGSTGSIYIGLSAITDPGDKVLLQRNSHRAAYNAVILNSLEPVYIYPHYNKRHNILTGISPEDIDKALREDPDIKAVFLTYPDYYGICCDLEAIREIVHRHNRVLMVDEAHGSHMGFSPRLPKSALRCGGDLVVQSTHKTLASFTQTSMIHIGSHRVDEGKLRDRINLYTTTSPSYLFIASCEIAAAYMDTEEGRKNLEANIDRSETTSKRLDEIPGVSVFLGDKDDRTIHSKDNTKILFKVEGMAGGELGERLSKEHNINLEMTDYYYGLALATLMNEKKDYEKLIRGVRSLGRSRKVEKKLPSIKAPRPSVSMSIHRAYYSEKTQVELKKSIGRVSATTIVPYPPGIPLIVPGETMTIDLYRHIMLLMENKIEITGLMGYNKDKLAVVK